MRKTLMMATFVVAFLFVASIVATPVYAQMPPKPPSGGGNKPPSGGNNKPKPPQSAPKPPKSAPKPSGGSSGGSAPKPPKKKHKSAAGTILNGLIIYSVLFY